MMGGNNVETFLSITALVISLLSAIFTGYTFFWTAARDQKQATLDAYNQLQEQALDYLNHYTPGNIREIAKDRRSEQYKTVSGYIARIEHFCVGVKLKIYDRNTVYELANGYLNSSIKSRIEPIIEAKNTSDVDYYANIHWVFDWMSIQRERQKGRGK